MHATLQTHICTDKRTSLAQSCVYVWGSGTKGSRAAMKSDMKRSTQKAEACACAAAAMVSRSAWSMMRSCAVLQEEQTKPAQAVGRGYSW
eukprot:1161892-Pelagomonas_calceolata.AAC.8